MTSLQTLAPPAGPPPPPRSSRPPAKIVRPLPKLSQSRIKLINAEDWCPLKFLKVDVEKQYREVPSVSQIRGQYFEYLAFGSLNREGEVPQLPRTSKGKVTAEEQRIALQASELKRVLPLYGFHVIATNIPMEVEWTPGVWMTMIYDVFGYWDRTGDPNPENNYRSGYYILDAKLTGNIHATYGPFGWGAPWSMNHLQAHIYKESAQRVLKSPLGKPLEVGFVYAVFDYKPNMEHKLVEIAHNHLNPYETKEQIRLAIERLEDANEQQFPPRPSFEQCKTCLVDQCPKRQTVPDVQVIH